MSNLSADLQELKDNLEPLSRLSSVMLHVLEGTKSITDEQLTDDERSFIGNLRDKVAVLRQDAQMMMDSFGPWHTNLVMCPSQRRPPERLWSSHRSSPQRISPESLLPQSITVLQLSARAITLLERAGITTVGQLVKKTEHDLLQVPLIGSITLREVKWKLEQRGLSLVD